jgi:hypothetical protein
VKGSLRRQTFLRDGIFGVFRFDDDDITAFYTLEHAYLGLSDSCPNGWSPKVPQGSYLCVRGIHRLAHGEPFETFEITAVPGHTGVLFHAGNYNADSEGCVLLGLGRDGDKMVTQSKAAFADFMDHLKGLPTFLLEVI